MTLVWHEAVYSMRYSFGRSHRHKIRALLLQNRSMLLNLLSREWQKLVQTVPLRLPTQHILGDLHL